MFYKAITTQVHQFMLFLLCIWSLDVLCHQRHQDLREALDIPREALPAVDGPTLLQAIRQAILASQWDRPFEQFHVFFYSQHLGLSLAEQVWVECRFGPEGSGPPTCAPAPAPTAPRPLHQLRVPVGEWDHWQHEEGEGAHYLSWAGIALVTYYAFKKGLNKWHRGTWLAADYGHSHILQTPGEVEREMAHYRGLIRSVVPAIKESPVMELELTQALEQSREAAARDVFAMAMTMAREAGKQCAGEATAAVATTTPSPSVARARETMLGPLQHFALSFARDIHHEIFRPVVELGRAAKDPFSLRQIRTFLELATIRTLKERGPLQTLGTGLFVASGQVVAEVIESVALPAGLHFYCHVGNAIVIGLAATAYASFFCLKNIRQLSHLSLSQKRQAMAHYLRLQWRGRGVHLRPLESFARFSPTDRLILTMRLLQYSTEKSLRGAFNLRQISHRSFRNLAAGLGELQREANLLSYQLQAHAISPLPDTKDIPQRFSQWADDLALVEEAIPSNNGGGGIATGGGKNCMTNFFELVASMRKLL